MRLGGLRCGDGLHIAEDLNIAEDLDIAEDLAVDIDESMIVSRLQAIMLSERRILARSRDLGHVEHERVGGGFTGDGIVTVCWVMPS
jgi:hypothetical protein